MEKKIKLYLVFNRPNEQTHVENFQYNCVMCSNLDQDVILLEEQILKATDYWTDKFNCNPIPGYLGTFIRTALNTELTREEITYCVEALVRFKAVLNNQKLNFILSWDNCD